jgi:hypothetical protein
MATSVEILVVGAKANFSLKMKTSFAVVASFPPLSHRASSSLWQSTFARKRGVLVHVGDPGMDTSGQLFWAFEILEEINMKRFRVLPQFRKDFFTLMSELLLRSPQQQLLLTSDSQFGPKPLLFKRERTLGSVMRLHDDHGLRLNSAMYIGG